MFSLNCNFRSKCLLRCPRRNLLHCWISMSKKTRHRHRRHRLVSHLIRFWCLLLWRGCSVHPDSTAPVALVTVQIRLCPCRQTPFSRAWQQRPFLWLLNAPSASRKARIHLVSMSKWLTVAVVASSSLRWQKVVLFIATDASVRAIISSQWTTRRCAMRQTLKRAPSYAVRSLLAPMSGKKKLLLSPSSFDHSTECIPHHPNKLILPLEMWSHFCFISIWSLLSNLQF